MSKPKIFKAEKFYAGDMLPEGIHIDKKGKAYLESRVPGEFVGFIVRDEFGNIKTFIALPTLKKYKLID